MPLVVYTFQSDFGANHAGDVVNLDPDDPMVQAALEAGTLAEATADDNVDDEATEEQPSDDPVPEQEASLRAIQSGIRQGFKEIQSALVKTNKAQVSIGNFATPKSPVFKTVGELCKAVYRANLKKDTTALNKVRAHEQELRQKAALGMNEADNTQGGYAVVPEWSNEIFSKIKKWPKLLDETTRVTISGSTYNMPAIDETSLADGSRGGGILAYAIDEAAAFTPSFPAMTTVQAVLHKFGCVVASTAELLEDNAYNLDSLINQKVAEEFLWMEDKHVISGSGSTTAPTGILNQPSLVTVTKEGSQTAATVNFANLKKMFSRLWPGCEENAVWLAEPQVWQQLVSMTFPDASGTYSAFGALSYNAHEPFPLMIWGRPVIKTQMSPALGTVGDLVLADLSQLYCVEHPGMRVDMDTSLYFLSDQILFRFIRRYDIKSPWTSAVTSNGVTYSPFVALSTRS